MNTRFVSIGSALVAATILLNGCSSVPKRSDDLQAAQASYEKARADADVLRYASDIVNRAGSTLEQAAAARDPNEMNSLAYVGAAQVATAQAVAQRRAAEAKVAELGSVKERVQLEAREAELAASRRKLDASQAKLAELQAKPTSRGMVLTLGSVLFVTGRSELLPGALGSVDRLAEYLKDNTEKSVLIEGHTDSTGSDSINLRLSQERAEAVRMALLSRGIAADRAVATGLGSSQPVASNDTAAGRQQNRRVEIIIK